jgi:hypothetical protein
VESRKKKRHREKHYDGELFVMHNRAAVSARQKSMCKKRLESKEKVKKKESRLVFDVSWLCPDRGSAVYIYKLAYIFSCSC